MRISAWLQEVSKIITFEKHFLELKKEVWYAHESEICSLS